MFILVGSNKHCRGGQTQSSLLSIEICALKACKGFFCCFKAVDRDLKEVCPGTGPLSWLWWALWVYDTLSAAFYFTFSKNSEPQK